MDPSRVKAFRIIGAAFGLLALVMIGFMVVGILLPSGWETERSRVIAAPPEEIFPYLERAEAWGLWTPSPDEGVELFGPPTGPGSGRRWDDPRYGDGEFEIVQVEAARRVEYRVEVDGGAIRIEGWLELTPVPEGTRVTWREEGDFGWNPLLGYLAGQMEELQGAQLDDALRALAELVTVRDAPGSS
jgi:uncharacterized protein YndB with AHSA1/START domain